MDLKYHSEKAFHGFGIFATSHLAQGEKVLRFQGHPITLQEAYLTPYALQVSETDYIEIEGIERFVNHRCEPNCGLLPGNQLVALKPIKAGEEITFDYSTCVLEDGTWSMDCACGASNCRGQIVEFDQLPLHLQLHYWEQGYVTDFISRQCGEFISQVRGVPTVPDLHHHHRESENPILSSTKPQSVKI